MSSDNDTMYVWQLTWEQVLNSRETYPRLTADLSSVTPPSNASEEEMHRVAWQQRQAENSPPIWDELPIGTWRKLPIYPGFTPVDQLWQVEVQALYEREREGKSQQLVDKYARWYTAGSNFPPLSVLQRPNRLEITQGHHRLLAAKRCGVTHLLAWVSPYFYNSRGTETSLTWEQAVYEAIRQGLAVPSDVLVSYAQQEMRRLKFSGKENNHEPY